METDYKALATRKFNDWQKLFDRMQTDADLVNLVKKFKHVPDVNGDEIANSIYMTLNDAADFTWRMETTLNSAVEQISVKSDYKRFDTAYIEAFLRAAFRAADKLLSQKGLFPLDPFLDQQNFRRGREAVRVYFHMEDGKLIPDLMPWDTRYAVYEHDTEGLKWGSYRTYRNRDQVLAEYPEASKGLDVSASTEIECLYILARDTSQLYIAGKLVKELPNRLGYVPLIYRMVPMGSMLMDLNTIQLQGESGLFLIRDLLPELNRLISIGQSLNLFELDHALQLDVPPEKLDNKDTPPTVDDVTAVGTVNKVAGKGYTSMPLGELRQQAEMIRAMIQARIDRATQNNFPTAKPTTATEIMALSQEQGNIIMPRLANRGLLKQDAAEMIIKQVIDSGETSVKLGNETWEISKLNGDYQIEFKYSFKDPRLDAARQSLATAQRGMIPDRAIRIETLMRDDWEKDEQELRWEEAERLSPLIKMNRTRRALGKAADGNEPGAEEELMMITLQMIPLLKQAMQGLVAIAETAPVEPGQPMLPLMAQSPSKGQEVTSA